MYNYGYRDYFPWKARFTTVDPIRDGFNWYAYCNNNPVNLVDVWGLSASDGDGVKDIPNSEFSRWTFSYKGGSSMADIINHYKAIDNRVAQRMAQALNPNITAYKVPIIGAGVAFVGGGNAELAYVWDSVGNHGLAAKVWKK